MSSTVNREYERISREEFQERKNTEYDDEDKSQGSGKVVESIEDDKSMPPEYRDYSSTSPAKGYAKVHFQVSKNEKMVTLDHQKKNKTENAHLGPKNTNKIENQTKKNNVDDSRTHPSDQSDKSMAPGYRADLIDDSSTSPNKQCRLDSVDNSSTHPGSKGDYSSTDPADMKNSKNVHLNTKKKTNKI